MFEYVEQGKNEIFHEFRNRETNFNVTISNASNHERNVGNRFTIKTRAKLSILAKEEENSIKL